MFELRTTIILGAGASQQFGFPVGRELQTEIVKDIDDLQTYLEQNPLNGLSLASGSNAKAFIHRPLATICSYLIRQPAGGLMPAQFEWGSLVQAMFSFRDELLAQTGDSVDCFIRDNPRYSFIGKILLASKIISKMYDYEPPSLTPTAISDDRC
jgi:hypothetical protein